MFGAARASRRFPRLAAWYGSAIRAGNSGVAVWREGNVSLAMFPVKRDWRRPALLPLIESCARSLVANPDRQPLVFLPLVGCGYGRLAEDDVLPILRGALADERFVLVRKS
ncbi:MAG: hypothetical protein U0166_02695 [Acidobacteriota bacterium]